jgi:type I restriction enzyme S subunit
MTVPYGTAVDTHVTIVRPATDVDPHFFGVQLLSRQGDFERAGVGSTGQTELSRAAISETPVIIPPKNLRDEFGRLVGPLREQIEVLSAQIVTLAAARDLLLPKLIAGEIDLEQAGRDADRATQRVAAA